MTRRAVALVAVAMLGTWGSAQTRETMPKRRPGGGVQAFVGATILDGSGRDPFKDGVMLVLDGRVVGVGRRGPIRIPSGAEIVQLEGRFIIPGLVNAHGHVGSTRGLESKPEFYTEDDLRAQLQMYARYGVTTVMSLGDDGDEGFRLRAEPASGRARLLVAGPIITAGTPDEARTAVTRLVERHPDFVKIRVDDNLGTVTKMPPAVYGAVIAESHRNRLKVAAHVFYLDDARTLVQRGVDYLAHSVRDQVVDPAFANLLEIHDVCYSPTLMREVSAFVYERRPAFFDDPFFTRAVDPALLRQLEDPARQARVRDSREAREYKRALTIAMQNVKVLADGGVRLAFGTDTGPPGRFQGYFEHLELERLVEAGLTPRQALLSATRDAASCIGADRDVGQLRPGRHADFVVLEANPLEDIRNTQKIESVWVAGRMLPR